QRLRGLAPVVDDDELGALAPAGAQELHRRDRRAQAPIALVVGRDDERERERGIRHKARGAGSITRPVGAPTGQPWGMRSRRARLSTLNMGVRGSSPRSVRRSGRLKLASSTPTKARSSASVGGSSASRGTTKAQPTSPKTGSGTPSTAARPTFG